jgi:hypothetical protein
MQVKQLGNGCEEITFSQAEIDEIHGEIAAEAGMTLEAYRAMLAQHMNQDWCQCGDKQEVGMFCDDTTSVRQHRNIHCVNKHHWHCANCDKLVQVG